MKTEHINLDITTLFLLRYVFNETNDVVNLKQDILDLQGFPERLLGSYQAEWDVFLRKKFRKSLLTSDTDPRELLSKLPQVQQDEYKELSLIVEKTLRISQASNIKVIKTPLKAYIEQLVKL